MDLSQRENRDFGPGWQGGCGVSVNARTRRKGKATSGFHRLYRDFVPRFHGFFRLFPWHSASATPDCKNVLAAVAPSSYGKQAGLMFPTGAFVFPDPGFPVVKGS
ncbi:MAG: hypothetical protein CFE31_07015 [Rhizobiales bacterium PAR1]|nr:MAG: hypothetical protein CFE31_07015 [Rhizobiales bacterium PAR1]